jgi:RNA polymerase sigma-70 factor (ECF subfamily)
VRESRQRTSTWAPDALQPGAQVDGREPSEAERDARLVAGVQAGDRAALAGLYDRHAPAMLGVALRILRDRGDAEDLVHDVFLEAWRKSASFSAQRGTVRAWLLVRVRSRAIDRLRSLEVSRRHARGGRQPGDGAAPAQPTEDPADGPDRRRARAALAALPDVQRSVLELAFFEGLSCSEIATRCNAPLGTVKSRLLAGVRELRRTLEVAEGPDGA